MAGQLRLCIHLKQKRINAFFTVASYKNLHIKFSGHLMNKSREWSKQLIMQGILKFIYQQYTMLR